MKAIIFDFFGVLCVGSRSYAMGQCPESSQPQLDELFRQADYGFITAQEFRAQAADLLGVSVEAFLRMMNNQYRRDETMLAGIKALRTRYKTALLSNANDAIIGELFTPQEQQELFDEVVVSSNVGMIKPQKELYELTAARLGVLPEECVMIDDIESNITGAKNAGMQGIVFENRQQYERELREMGIDA